MWDLALMTIFINYPLYVGFFSSSEIWNWDVTALKYTVSAFEHTHANLDARSPIVFLLFIVHFSFGNPRIGRCRLELNFDLPSFLRLFYVSLCKF